MWKGFGVSLVTFEQFIESGKRALESIKDWKKVALKVKEIVHLKYPDARIYVFGSSIEGNFTAMSDIDILVVQDGIEKDYDLKSEIFRKVDAPLELHFVNEAEFKNWYLKFIKKFEEV